MPSDDSSVEITQGKAAANRRQLGVPLRLDVFEILLSPFAEQKLALQSPRRFRGHWAVAL
jgi:hypothetical protein